MSAAVDPLRRGDLLGERAWQRRHLVLLWLLLVHVPALFAFGIWRGVGAQTTAEVLVAPFGCVLLARLPLARRPRAILVAVGLAYCSAVLVAFSGGSGAAHLHAFALLGFVALYQDWVPLAGYAAVAALGYAVGAAAGRQYVFDEPAALSRPWMWSAVYVAALLAAGGGVVAFWVATEQEARRVQRQGAQRSETEVSRRRFTGDPPQPKPALPPA